MPIEAETALMRESAQAFGDGPRLLADIGATNARFALERVPGRVEAIGHFFCAEFAGIADVVQAYLQQQGGVVPRHASFAIATPIDGDQVKMTNRDWRFSIEETRRTLGFDTLLLVNDFTALAMALPRLSAGDLVRVGDGAAVPDGAIGVIGPGSGLGVSGLICAQDRWIPLASEGGHTTFAPADERELFILQYAWREMAHVSSERFVSGPGLELIHRALGERSGAGGGQPRSAAEIVAHALRGSDPLCAEAVDCFCALLGTVASNLALTLGAVGGIYIGGGIVPRLGDLFQRSPFRQRFEAKGRYADYLRRIPTLVITAPYAALLGVSAILDQHLQAGTAGGAPAAGAPAQQ